MAAAMLDQLAGCRKAWSRSRRVLPALAMDTCVMASSGRQDGGSEPALYPSSTSSFRCAAWWKAGRVGRRQRCKGRRAQRRRCWRGRRRRRRRWTREETERMRYAVAEPSVNLAVRY
ncbi:unnamed protein product [Urochloa humidicola]